MYDKAPRIIDYVTGSTDEKVGPGSYNIAGSLLRQGESYAPFLSLRRRQVDNEEAKFLPGPGQYNIDTKSHVIGGSCMQDRSLRFHQRVLDTPAPGAYEISLKKANRAKSHKIDSIKVVRQQRIHVAPSIPIQSESYGYEENECGNLVRQAVPERDDTIGPAFYNPNYNLPVRGCTFHKGSERKLFEVNTANPGPGSYETHVTRKVRAKNVNCNKEVRKSYFKPRENVQPLQPEVVEPKKPKEGLPAKKVPFGIQSERFVYKENKNPGPCDYQRNSRNFPPIPRKDVPFGSTALRFLKQEKSRATFYYPGESRVEKKIRKPKKTAGFNTSTARFALPVESPTPGPMEYFEIPAQTNRTANFSSFFASKTERFTTADVNEEVGPGSYDVEKPAKQKPKKSVAGFSSSDRRFDSKFIKILTRQPDLDFPGPNNYTTRNSLSKGNMWTTASVRFADGFCAGENTPGPGFYELPDSVMNTLNRRTYNVNLSVQCGLGSIFLKIIPAIDGEAVL